MHACSIRHAPAVVIWNFGSWLQQSAHRIDAWLAARAKSREDSLALEAMTDRELRDIGIDPARVNPVPWTRDWTI